MLPRHRNCGVHVGMKAAGVRERSCCSEGMGKGLAQGQKWAVPAAAIEYAVLAGRTGVRRSVIVDPSHAVAHTDRQVRQREAGNV